MTFIQQLSREAIIATLALIAMKFFGVLSLASTFLAGKDSEFNWLPIVLGCAWFLAMVVAGVFSVRAWKVMAR